MRPFTWAALRAGGTESTPRLRYLQRGDQLDHIDRSFPAVDPLTSMMKTKGQQVTPPLAFLDTETTGLSPDEHEIWDVGLIVVFEDDVVEEHQWFLPVDLGRADAAALRIGRFHERHPHGHDHRPNPLEYITDLGDFANDFADRTRDAHLVGNVVSFDEERLRKLLRFNGACPEWHYHIVDTEALIAGKFGIEPPWDSEELSRMVEVDPYGFDRHTAMGDARWARAEYEAVMNRKVHI